MPAKGVATEPQSQQPEGSSETSESEAPVPTTGEPAVARSPRRGPLPNTTNRIEQERRELVPTLRAHRRPGEPYRDAIIRLERTIRLPGRGTRENNIDELARVWGATEGQSP